MPDLGKAARLLAEASRTGRRLPGLPEGCLPTNNAEVNAILTEAIGLLGGAIAGWKTGGYALKDVPILCPLPARIVFFDESPEIPLASLGLQLAEAEICFRLVADLPPRGRLYTATEVAAAVVPCAAIELLGTRFQLAPRTVESVLATPATRLELAADLYGTGAYVVGPGLANWTEVDFAALRVQLLAGDRMLYEGVGGHPLVDPFLPCVVVANTLRRAGGLHRGQFLATASFSGAFPVPLGKPVFARFQGFPQASATIVG